VNDGGSGKMPYKNPEDEKRWRQSKKGKKSRRSGNIKYRQTAKGKTMRKKEGKKYRESVGGQLTMKNWRDAHKEHIQKYNQSASGKLARDKANKKHFKTEKYKMGKKRREAKRKRNLGWTMLFPNPFANNVEVVWHHISDDFVIAMPKNIHQLYCGYEEHRELCMNVVSQLYEVLP
jgi:hypothetical protein